MTTSPTTGTAAIHGIEIYYEVRGTGPAVLMISGATGDAGHFTQAAKLLATDHTVITYDRRGNSRSPATGPTSLDQQADDAAELLRQLHAAPATVFGTSGGAVIALRLAIRSPAVVKNLIIHEPPLIAALPHGGEMAAGFKAQLEQALARGGVRGATEAFIRENAGDDAFDHLEPALRERMLNNGAWLFEQELAMFTGWVPSAAELAKLTMPVRILAGHDTTNTPPHLGSEWLAEALQRRVDEIPGAHAPYLAHPGEFVSALRPLLDPPR